MIVTLAAIPTHVGIAAPSAGTTTVMPLSDSFRFETYADPGGNLHFVMTAKNGETLLQSLGYPNEQSLRHDIGQVVENGKLGLRYNMLQTASGDYMFVLTALNGEELARSPIYSTVQDAQRAMQTTQSLITNHGTAYEVRPAPAKRRFDVYKGEDGNFRWDYRFESGEIALTSDGYSDRNQAMAGALKARAWGGVETNWEIVPVDDAHVTVRLKVNGTILARGHAYSSEIEARRAIARLSLALAAPADIKVAKPGDRG